MMPYINYVPSALAYSTLLLIPALHTVLAPPTPPAPPAPRRLRALKWAVAAGFAYASATHKAPWPLTPVPMLRAKPNRNPNPIP